MRVNPKWIVLALVSLLVFETLAGGFLVLRYAQAGAYGAMAAQFVGFLVSLVGCAYGGAWLADHWR